MRQVERDTNSDCGNAARGIKVELRAILTEGMLRLRPAIFTQRAVRAREAAVGRSGRDSASAGAVERRRNIQTRCVSFAEQPDHRTDRGTQRVCGPSQRQHCDCLLAGEILDRSGNVAVGFSGMLPAGISEQAKAGRGRAARAPGDFGSRDVRPAHLPFPQCDGAKARPGRISVRRSRRLNSARRSRLRARPGTGKAGNCWAPARPRAIGAESSRD